MGLPPRFPRPRLQSVVFHRGAGARDPEDDCLPRSYNHCRSGAWARFVGGEGQHLSAAAAAAAAADASAGS
eukprot:scaffold733_cov267-Pinguiococcus_pyrenoidosus.AAC.31